jgi:hypothetical protein
VRCPPPDGGLLAAGEAVGEALVGVGVGDADVGCGVGLRLVVVGFGRADLVGVGLADGDRLGVSANVVVTYGVGEALRWWGWL